MNCDDDDDDDEDDDDDDDDDNDNDDDDDNNDDDDDDDWLHPKHQVLTSQAAQQYSHGSQNVYSSNRQGN